MKVTFEVNPDNVEDQFSYKCLVKSKDMYFALSDIQELIRNKLKYESLPEKEYEIYLKIQEEFIDIINERNIGDIDEF